MTGSTATSGLAPTGLSEEQLRHFSEHGWVLLEGVLSEEDCRMYIDCVDTMLAVLLSTPGGYTQWTRGNRRGFPDPVCADPRFATAFKTPGLFPALRQIIGVDDVRYNNAIATSTVPDPERATLREELSDPRLWGWHRDHRPRYNVFDSERYPGMIQSLAISAVMFFTPLSPEGGATAFLDGSHVIDFPQPETGGRQDELEAPEFYDRLAGRCEVVQPTAGPGSIVLFTESLVHAATHVLSEQRRVAMFTWVNAPWILGDDLGRRPHLIERYTDEELRTFFDRPSPL